MSIKVTDEALARITVPIQEVKVYDSKDVTVTFQGIEIKGPDSVRHWQLNTMLLSKESCDTIQNGFHEDTVQNDFHEDNTINNRPLKIDDVAMLNAVNAELNRQGLRMADGENVFSDTEYLVDEMCDGLETLIEAVPLFHQLEAARAQGPSTVIQEIADKIKIQDAYEALEKIRRSGPAVFIVDDPHSDEEPVSLEKQLKATAAWEAAVGMSHPESVARFKEREILFFNKQLQTGRSTQPVFGGIWNMHSRGWDLKCESLLAPEEGLLNRQLTHYYQEVNKAVMMPYSLLAGQDQMVLASGIPSYTCRSHGCPQRAPYTSQCQCYTCGKMMEKL